jgi:hypothetical protein
MAVASQAAAANATHLVGMPAVVADHLRAFIGDVLGDGAVALFLWSLWLATRLGYSFVGVLNRLLDEIFWGVLDDAPDLRVFERVVGSSSTLSTTRGQRQVL